MKYICKRTIWIKKKVKLIKAARFFPWGLFRLFTNVSVVIQIFRIWFEITSIQVQDYFEKVDRLSTGGYGNICKILSVHSPIGLYYLDLFYGG